MRNVMIARTGESVPASKDRPDSRDLTTGRGIAERNDAFERDAGPIPAEVMSASVTGPEWSLSKMSIGAPFQLPDNGGAGSESAQDGARSIKPTGRALLMFPYQAQIEPALGTRIAGDAVVDPVACARHHVLAFTEHRRVHFATAQPSLQVAAHEAAHVVQHAGITNESGLGPERHASTVSHLIAAGRSARGLIGPAGTGVPSSVRPYTEVPVASQTTTEWNAKMPLRVAEDGRMAVGQDRDMHNFWAESSLVAQSNSTLASRKSVIRLNELSDTLSGSAPTGGGGHTLSKVTAKNAATATEGDAMNIWADCGKSARDVMGAGEGTGKGYDKMTASFTGPQKPPGWLKYMGVVPILLSGTPTIGKHQTAASDPEDMKKEIFNEKLGGKGDAGLQKYQALSPAEKEKFDKETGINRFAAPGTGQGYTMSSGGAPVAGHTTWNFHWAGVVMALGENRVTLENYSISRPDVQNSKWQFQMYGAATKARQTFYEQHKATGEHGDAPTAMQVEKN